MAQPRKYAAKVSDTGELQLAEPLIWRAALSRLKGQVVYVIVEKLRANRSLQANRRYWGMVVPLAAEVLSVTRDIPLSSEQAHEVLKYAFMGHDDTPLGPVPRSTRNLDTAQFYEYTQKVEEWLLHSYGVVIPAAGESIEEVVI